MKRPKLKIALMPIDWILEVCGALLLAFTCYYLLAEYANLPPEVPVHFDFWGNPNISWLPTLHFKLESCINIIAYPFIQFLYLQTVLYL